MTQVLIVLGLMLASSVATFLFVRKNRKKVDRVYQAMDDVKRDL